MAGHKQIGDVTTATSIIYTVYGHALSFLTSRYRRSFRKYMKQDFVLQS